jgi:hypothetical protein
VDPSSYKIVYTDLGLRRGPIGNPKQFR